MAAIVYSTSPRATQALGELLREAGMRPLTPEEAQAEGACCEVVVINAPLAGQDAQALALRLAREVAAGVLFLSPEPCPQAEEAGALWVAKPLSRALFLQAVRHSRCLSRRLGSLGDENSQLRSKLDELRRIDRAKLLLMQYLGMSEAQAHRYIEKQAMDLRVSRAEVARSILINYAGPD